MYLLIFILFQLKNSEIDEKNEKNQKRGFEESERIDNDR